MQREPREVWRKRVERWAESGLTAKEFAKQSGVNVHTLTGWKWRLSCMSRRPPASTAAPVGFVEVVATAAAEGPKSTLGATGGSSAPQPIELILAGGACLRIPFDFDPAMLRRVVEALGAR